MIRLFILNFINSSFNILRYNTLFNPPRTDEVKERCLGHPQDSEDTVKKHLERYYSFSDELTEYYTDEGVSLWLFNPH